jgi:hypothetical protein
MNLPDQRVTNKNEMYVQYHCELMTVCAGKKAGSRKCIFKKSKSDSCWKNIRIYRQYAWQIKEDSMRVMGLAGALRTRTPAFVAKDRAPQVKF